MVLSLDFPSPPHDQVIKPKGELFAPEEQRDGNKRQRQEIEKEGEGEENKGEGRKWAREWSKRYLTLNGMKIVSQ